MRALPFLTFASVLSLGVSACGDSSSNGPNPFADGGFFDGAFGDGSTVQDGASTGGCERFDFRATGSACTAPCPSVKCDCPGTFPRNISACTKQGCLVSTNCAEVCGASSLGEAVSCTDTFGVGDAAPPPSDTGKADTGCTPRSCGSLGKNCGTTDVGCGFTEDCGTCTGTNTCGGGGTANVCGCTPTTCAAAGAACGNLSNGCGGTLVCTDTCTSPNWCGGGGVENKCGCMASGSLPRTGSATASVAWAGGTRTWDGTSQALVSDDKRAQVSALVSGETSQYLVVKGFGFKLPPNAVITGITLAVEKSGYGSLSVVDASIRLVKEAVVVGADKANATPWPNADSTASYGGTADLWGTTWTANEVNSPDFGAAVAAKYTSSAGNEWAQVDQIKLTVHFTVPGC